MTSSLEFLLVLGSLVSKFILICWVAIGAAYMMENIFTRYEGIELYTFIGLIIFWLTIGAISEIKKMKKNPNGGNQHDPKTTLIK